MVRPGGGASPVLADGGLPPPMLEKDLSPCLFSFLFFLRCFASANLSVRGGEKRADFGSAYHHDTLGTVPLPWLCRWGARWG